MLLLLFHNANLTCWDEPRGVARVLDRCHPRIGRIGERLSQSGDWGIAGRDLSGRRLGHPARSGVGGDHGRGDSGRSATDSRLARRLGCAALRANRHDGVAGVVFSAQESADLHFAD